MPADAKRPRGRPPAAIDPAALPAVARVLRQGIDARRLSLSAAAGLAGVLPSTLHRTLTGPDPGVRVVGRVLRVIRPADKDGGWGWFGRQLAAQT